MHRFSFFLISFICSIFLFISPVFADEEIEIDNDFLIEEEIETETQEEVIEEHIEDIEEDLEDEEIEEEQIETYDYIYDEEYQIYLDDFVDYIDNSNVDKLGNGFYVVFSGSTGIIHYGRILSLGYPFIYHEDFYYFDKLTQNDNVYIYENNDVYDYFNQRKLISFFSDGGNISLDNASFNVDNTQIVEKLDNVLNTFYIMVFIVCTILGFLLAYIFVKMLFKI